jgi:dolichyl-phosphate beta-glucosyltransferase
MSPEISLVIPAYEEAARLGGPLRRVLEYLDTEKINSEVILVDDGSGDQTSEIARDEFVQFPGVDGRVIRYEPNRGKGYAVRTGLKAARADIALFSDADFSSPIEEMPKLVEPIKNGEFDVTLGSRALDRSLIGTHQPWSREQGGKIVNLIIRTMSHLPFADTQCGFKAFNMTRFRPLLNVMTIDRFGFDVEFLFVAKHHGLRLKEVPVRWNNVEGSKVNALRDTRRMIGELRQIRRNERTGVYDLK